MRLTRGDRSDKMTESCALIGKYVLAGIIYEDESGTVTRKVEKHGRIVSISDESGLVIRNPTTGEEFSLPPDADFLRPARPGQYNLRTTGEVITDPDFTCVWTISPGDSGGEEGDRPSHT